MPAEGPISSGADAAPIHAHLVLQLRSLADPSLLLDADELLQVKPALAGRPAPREAIDPELAGYRGSAPVRWGNDAARQSQHDVYGEVLDCAFQWAATGGAIGPGLWDRLTALSEAARTAWSRPDHGIWEVRSSPRPFTCSAALCQVAPDRAAASRDGWDFRATLKVGTRTPGPSPTTSWTPPGIRRSGPSRSTLPQVGARRLADCAAPAARPACRPPEDDRDVPVGSRTVGRGRRAPLPLQTTRPHTTRICPTIRPSAVAPSYPYRLSSWKKPSMTCSCPVRTASS